MIRRAVFLSLGTLEFLVALVLVGFAWQLPGPREVHDRVGRVERVSRASSAQVQALREQVQTLRERRPSGTSACRHADRQSLPWLCQPPPRSTRWTPRAGPGGSRRGLAA